MQLIRYASIGIFAILPVVAENGVGPVNGPLLGYVNKSTQLRPVIGIPGAAYFGPPVDLESLELAAVSSESAYAILLTSDRTGVHILPLGSTGAAHVLVSSGTAVDAVRLSARGMAAALIRGSDIEIVTGLPENPALKKTLALPYRALAIAVSDDGDALAVLETRTLTIYNSVGQLQLPVIATTGDLRFRPNSHDLIYIDGSAVMAVSSGAVKTIAGPSDGVSLPRAAVFSHDSRFVWVADAGTRDLLKVDPADGVSERIHLSCVPAELAPLKDSTLRLQCEGEDPVRLVQLTASGARVLFIPEPVE